jgi:hypothetical protein
MECQGEGREGGKERKRERDSEGKRGRIENEGYSLHFYRTFAYETYYYGIYFYDIYFYGSILLRREYTSP